ncbi:PaaX family transcriptional regulator C-terminal domain-containing protein [Ruegeria arenilitoris]|uniref:PaaX family transcriptional regulator C-terminal domain-containing protein n=1 Tax=Ruegeria arenilitoris TaxID=1173585 RepID=UPI00147C5C24|nr:PaaX family transcriptional regulator C-terminal domain-containing protein [Ruegeria arenilitoris]
MVSKDTWFQSAVAELTDPQNQRVWSIIVSLFGDLAQEPGSQISGGALTRIIEPIGVKPEAIRVALHRLRKDGWIKSDRIGRVSRHFLTDFGRTQSIAVSPRIYAQNPKPISHWHLLIAEEGSGTPLLEDMMLSHEYTPISRTVALGPGPVPERTDGLLAFEVTARSVPEWVQQSLCSTDLRSSCRELMVSAQRTARARPAAWRPTPTESATLRLLLVHRWRRVVLRQPDLPPEFFPPDWAGAECRRAVFQLLEGLPRPTLDTLNETEEP